MLEVGMLHHILGRIHDFGHTCLVVGTEQGRAVGGNHRLAFILLHLRKFRNTKDDVLFFVQDDVIAVIIRDDLWLDVGTRSIGRGIDMGDEANSGNFPIHVGRDGSHHIAVFVKGGLNAHSLQFIAKHLQEIQLFGGAGLRFGIFIGGRLHRDVSQEFI